MENWEDRIYKIIQEGGSVSFEWNIDGPGLVRCTVEFHGAVRIGHGKGLESAVAAVLGDK